MKVLIVCTNHETFPTKTGKTGLWLSELTYFYDVMSKRRVLMDIVSPLGGKIPIDERSLELKDECNAKYWEDAAFRAKLNNSLSPAQIHSADYRLVYFAGGHGAMWDLAENTDLQNIVRDVYERNGIVSAVCHGVCGLLNVKLSDGSWLIQDKYVTGFSNVEEALMSFVSEVPFYLEDKLKERGAHYTKSMIPFMEFIEMDERLITGQNPNSAKKVASKALEELFEK
ncbi:type 1 glutamine amidotransferase domain-containing protein [Dyadobacter chenhuakuii]|uniref:Type 1 glutamine amidotransferase domain-containing protein n=1 Tax=Dyadobacter chenhuakuii TaxID=2909339 RepID=A0ABY4XKS7_9BACT|nr:type 1 glutamine amidotransferase domain-containing protein [Dyadobacter chenhuakuii]MCF2493508.1 type 1 glutamine amidotransferase domain-containing protein [Dyadobacter chenhuakuii]USJ30648.1 type 1 glutamine amidotransferase domain-containing protein [Dyadobacter chenhuakuii]